MLDILAISPTIPVTDLQRARGFYEGILGLTPLDAVPDFGVITYRLENGAMLDIFKRETASSGEHTVANFYIQNLEQAAEALIEKGVHPVVFELDGEDSAFDERGIIFEHGTAQAFFLKDPDGNWLSFNAIRDSIAHVMKRRT